MTSVRDAGITKPMCPGSGAFAVRGRRKAICPGCRKNATTGLPETNWKEGLIVPPHTVPAPED